MKPNNRVIMAGPEKRAQSMVEFAIVLPLLLLVLFGTIEVGRAIFIYSSITSASREAVRFGSAWGTNGPGFQYRNCAGIRSAAKKTAFLMSLSDSNITIKYDHGPGSSLYSFECDATSGDDFDVRVNSGDRILVTVTTQYTPIIPLIIMTPKTFSVWSARTIMGTVEIKTPTSP